MDITILLIVGTYFVVILGQGFWVARKEKKSADVFFLAGRKLPWYAISLSMTGANIGAEHFVGMHISGAAQNWKKYGGKYAK